MSMQLDADMLKIKLSNGGSLTVRLPSVEETRWVHRWVPSNPAWPPLVRRKLALLYGTAILAVAVGGKRLGLPCRWPRDGAAPGADAARAEFLDFAVDRLERWKFFDSSDERIEAVMELMLVTTARHHALERSLAAGKPTAGAAAAGGVTTEQAA